MIDTAPSEQLLFAVIAIETAADKYAVSPSELSMRLEKQGMIEGRLWKHYDLLHNPSTAMQLMSDDYIADEFMLAKSRSGNQAARPRQK